MKLLLAIIVLVVFALSLVADHQWRKWMAQRGAGHDHDQTRRP